MSRSLSREAVSAFCDSESEIVTNESGIVPESKSGLDPWNAGEWRGMFALGSPIVHFE